METFTEFIRRNREEFVARPGLVIEMATGCVGLHTGNEFVPLSRGDGLALNQNDLGKAQPARRTGFRPFDAALLLRNSDAGLSIEMRRS